MFHPFTPSLDGNSTDHSNAFVGFNSFGTGFDFTNQFAGVKKGVCASPITDSLADDLSTSSGGVMKESVPHSSLAPSSTHMHGLPSTGTLNSHLSVGTPLTLTKVNDGGSPFFQFTKAIEADADEDGNAGYDFAGLESLVMAAVADNSNAPTPTHHSHTTAAAATAAAAASTTRDDTPGTPHRPTPFVVTTTTTTTTAGSGGLPKKRSCDTISPVPSRGSPSVVPGGSPSIFSGDGAFLYSNFGPELISTLPPPRILPAASDPTSPLLLATTTPLMGAELSTHTNTSVMNSSCTTATSHSATSQLNDAEVRSNLFICGLPVTVTDKELTDIFAKYGTIESAKVMLDIHTGRSRGIAFVKFRDVEDAENAVDTLNGTSLNGHPITVRVANSRAAYLPGNPTNKTFVRNVPLAVSRSTLMDYFSQFGEVTDLSIKSDTAQGRHHGASAAAAAAATSATTATATTTAGVEEGVEGKLNIVFITYATKEAAARAAEATHTKAPFKECNGVPLLAKVAEDTTRRMERLSRRVRSGAGLDSKDVSTTSAGTTATVGSMTYASAPMTCVPGLPHGMTMLPMTATAGYPGATYVTVPNMSGSDMSAMTLMPASVANSQHVQPQHQQPHQQQQQQQLSVFRDAHGNLIYAAPAPSPSGVAYAMTQPAQQHPQQPPSVYYAPPPPPQPQPQPQRYVPSPNAGMPAAPPQFQTFQQQQQQQVQNSPGQIVYVQASNGSVVPVMYGSAPTSSGQMSAAPMSPYYVMMSN